MKYFMKEKGTVISGVILLVAGSFLLLSSLSGGALLFAGLLFIVGAIYHRNNPALVIEDDHLVWNPALLRSSQFIAQNAVVSIDREAGSALTGRNKLILSTNDGRRIVIAAEQLAGTDPNSLQVELEAWAKR